MTAIARARPAAGFTLVEMLTVMSILAIILAFAVPSFREFLAGQRIKAASFDLTSALLLARSEALKRNASVQISRSGDQWNQGWRVSAIATDSTLSTQGTLDSSLAFAGAPAAIVFNAHGRVSSPAALVQIELSSSHAGTTRRCIALSPSGQARSSTGACP